MWKPRVVQKLIDNTAQARADHKLRHRPSGFGFVFADRIGYLSSAQWDQLADNASVFIQRSYLEVVESHGPDNLTGRYALIFRDRQPVAAVSAQIASLRGSDLVKRIDGHDNSEARRVKKALSKASQKLKSKAIDRVKAKVLVCGNLLSWGMHGVAFASDENPADLWPAVAEAMYRIRRAEKLSSHVGVVMIKDVPDEHADHAAALKRFSYDAIDPEPDIILAIAPEWRSHADYLNALDRKYRKATVKVLESVTEAGYTVEPAVDIDAIAPRLYELYMHVHERAAVRPFTLPPSFIPSLASALGPRFRCTVVRRDNEIAGFVTTLKDGDTAVGYYLGYDPAVNESVPVYFRLLQAVVSDAIELGCTRLSLGRTALEPKARLGAQPVPLRLYLRHRQPILNTILRPLLGLVPHHDAPERNPSK